MKLVKTLAVFSLLLIYINDANAQAWRYQKPAAILSSELLITPEQRLTKGILIDSLEDFSYNKMHDLVVTKTSGQTLVLPYKTLWGVRYYYADGSIKFYRVYPDRYYGFELYCIRVVDEDSLVLYATIGSRKHSPIYYFSGTITSKIRHLDFTDLEREFKTSNPYFLKLVSREMNVWTGYQAIDKKTNEFIILELYKASLKKQDTIAADTSLYHLKKLKRDGKHWLFNLQFNQYTMNNSPNNLMSRFPYYTLDTITGAKTSGTEIINKQPFQKKPLFVDLCLEYDRFKNCYGLQMGFTGDYSKSFHFGLYYGLALDINLSASDKRKITIKPGLSLSYNTYSDLVADIDNENKYMTVLNSTFDPTFSIAHHHKYSTTTYTYYQAKDLKVYYSVKCWSICPMLTIANNRLQRIYWALNAGWNLPIYDNSGFTMQQRNGNYNGTSVSTPFTNGAVTSNASGHGLFKAPFKFGGPFLGVSLGFYLNGR